MGIKATPFDVDAATEVCDMIAADADALDFDQAVEFMDALERLRRQAKLAVDMILSTMLDHLEAGGPRQYGTRTFLPVDDTVKRFDHDEVLRKLGAVALIDDNGEIRNPGEALELMAEMVRDVYLSESTQAKVTALAKLDLDPDDFRERLRRGRKVRIIDSAE
jgi:hypothetical protein